MGFIWSVKKYVHFNWGWLLCFFFIASITTEEISMLTTSSYPSLTIPSLNAATFQINKNTQQQKKIKGGLILWFGVSKHKEKIMWGSNPYLSCHNQRRGFEDGHDEGCRGWWEELRKDTFGTNQMILIRWNIYCPSTMTLRMLVSMFPLSATPLSVWFLKSSLQASDKQEFCHPFLCKFYCCVGGLLSFCTMIMVTTSHSFNEPKSLVERTKCHEKFCTAPNNQSFY